MRDHRAHAVVRKQFQQRGAVERERNDVRAVDAAVAGLDGVLQVERRVVRQEARLQHGFGLVRRQFADLAAARILHQRRFGDEDQLFGVQGDRGGDGHVFHRQVEQFARRREAQRRQQDDVVLGLQDRLDLVGRDLAGDARQFVVDAVDDAERARRDEVAGDDADVGIRHRRVGQPLAERGLDVQAQFAGGFLGAFHRGAVGDAHAVVEAAFDVT